MTGTRFAFSANIGAFLATDLFIAELALKRVNDIFEVILSRCSVIEARLLDCE